MSLCQSMCTLGVEVQSNNGTEVLRYKGTKVQRHLPSRHVRRVPELFGAELA